MARGSRPGGQERSDPGNGSGGQERSDPGNGSGGQERSDPGNGSGGQERSDPGSRPRGREWTRNDGPVSDCHYRRLAESDGYQVFESTLGTASNWDAGIQHGSPPLALLTRAIEELCL